MKNLKYILIPALTGIFFTACNTEPVGPSAAELDTQVEAKVKAATDQLKAECDSRLMQAAQLKADSLIAKAAGKKPIAVAPAPKPKPSTPATVPTKGTPKQVAPKSEPSKTVQGGGLRTQSDKAKAHDKKAVEGGGLRSQSDAAKAKDSKAVEGGGLRSQSDKNVEKK